MKGTKTRKNNKAERRRTKQFQSKKEEDISKEWSSFNDLDNIEIDHQKSSLC